MKWTWMLVVATVSALGQTNEVIPLFVDGSRTYTNARIDSVKSGYAIVIFDGGGKRLKVEDLPEPFRSKYYDHGNTEAERAALLEKKSAQQEQIATARAAMVEAQNWIGEEQRVSVVKITGYGKCFIDAEKGSSEVYMRGLPKSVGDFFSQQENLNSRISMAIDDAKSAQNAAEEAEAVAPSFVSGSPAFVASESEKMDRANLLRVEAKRKHEELVSLERESLALSKIEKRRTTIMARPTGKTYGGLRIWEYRGQPTLKRSDSQ
jgi:hypothetical protein